MAKARRHKRMEPTPGYDGAQEFVVPVRISGHRVEKRIMRARPGTFEWRYARDGKDLALYHAGTHYAVLWERAGTADGRTPDMSQSGGASWKGLPDGRVAALDDLRAVMSALGLLSSSRLTSYCVKGHAVSEMAEAHGVPVRDMAAVLHMDLRGLAEHLKYR